jgi:hypothetical protein
MQHTTAVSEAACRHCGRPLLYAWDEGLLIRADAEELADAVAAGLRAAGLPVYVRTHGGNLIHETPERAGTLRLARSRHVEHRCSRRSRPGVVAEQLAFDLR